MMNALLLLLLLVLVTGAVVLALGVADILARLDRDGHTELAADVRAGKVSANAAAIKVGYVESSPGDPNPAPIPFQKNETILTPVRIRTISFQE